MHLRTIVEDRRRLPLLDPLIYSLFHQVTLFEVNFFWGMPTCVPSLKRGCFLRPPVLYSTVVDAIPYNSATYRTAVSTVETCFLWHSPRQTSCAGVVVSRYHIAVSLCLRSAPQCWDSYYDRRFGQRPWSSWALLREALQGIEACWFGDSAVSVRYSPTHCSLQSPLRLFATSDFWLADERK